MSGSRPTGDQLLWFCLSERGRNMGHLFDNGHLSGTTSSLQSHLCYIVAPKSPDTRVRWLSELTSMVTEARRMSQVFPFGPTGDFSKSNLTVSSSSTIHSTSVSNCRLLFDPSMFVTQI